MTRHQRVDAAGLFRCDVDSTHRRRVTQLGRRHSAPFSDRIQGGRLDFSQGEIARDPFPHYESLRRHGSVTSPRHDAWIVLGYDEVQTVQAADVSRTDHITTSMRSCSARPSRHASIRSIVARYFTSETLGCSTPSRQRAHALLAPRLDVVASFSRPLTMRWPAGHGVAGRGGRSHSRRRRTKSERSLSWGAR